MGHPRDRTPLHLVFSGNKRLSVERVRTHLLFCYRSWREDDLVYDRLAALKGAYYF